MCYRKLTTMLLLPMGLVASGQKQGKKKAIVPPVATQPAAAPEPPPPAPVYNYDKTSWGMTVEQVKAAYLDVIETHEKEKTFLVRSGVVVGVSMEITFCIDVSGLRSVTLSQARPKNIDPDLQKTYDEDARTTKKLKSALESKYGPVTIHSSKTRVSWETDLWLTNDTKIELTWIREGPMISLGSVISYTKRVAEAGL